MGIIKDALKSMYEEQGIEVEFLDTKSKLIKSAAQSKYDDLRKTERNYVRGVHNTKNRYK